MTDPTANPSPEPLQFDRAVDAGAGPPDAQSEPSLACSKCSEPIKTYYHVDGNAVCAKCKQIAETSSLPQRSGRAFIKAFLLGSLGAVIGSVIHYGFGAITGLEWAVVAILIGFIVGAAVRKGAPAGGRRYQVMALLLTYFSVGLAYTPDLIKGAMEGRKSRADSLATFSSTATNVRDDDSIAADTNAASVVLAAQGVSDSGAVAPNDLVKKIGLGKALLAVGVILVGAFLMVFALPVIAVVSSLPGGLISAFIIALGMHQAWKMTARHVPSITGPYQVGDAPPGAATEAGEPAPEPTA